MPESPPLLYSLAEFDEILRACLDAAHPGSIAEVGSERGRFTTWLLANAPRSCEALYVIEPTPDPAVRELVERDPRGRLVEDLSPGALRAIPACDAYFVDGDHNYATVTAELETLGARGQPFPLVFLHDVCWPWGRRDHYHDPERLAPGDRHEYRGDLGPKPGQAALMPDGFGAGTLNPAAHEGGPRNGVRTAIDDFRAAHEAPLAYREVPVVFGLGVLYPRAAPYAAELDALLAPFDGHPLLARVEWNRVQMYARVTELAWSWGQEARAREAAERDLAEAREELARLRDELTRPRG